MPIKRDKRVNREVPEEERVCPGIASTRGCKKKPIGRSSDRPFFIPLCPKCEAIRQQLDKEYRESGSSAVIRVDARELFV